MKKLFTAMAFAALALAACNHRRECQAPMPPAPDYTDAGNWYVVDRNAGVDLFYITSTETADYRQDGAVQHYADMSSDSLKALLLGEMQGIDSMYSGWMNFFSPFYRQCTLETFVTDSVLEARLPLAMGDVEQAFSHYIKHLNNGRPYILAGFSQGAAGVVHLLKSMDDEAYSRMVAAYVIGWKITDADVERHLHIRPAQDSADLGVAVCFNSERSPDCEMPMFLRGNRVAINPANWCTDATPAVRMYRGDTLTIKLDTATRMLCVDGYSRNDYHLPLIGTDGNYHRLDILLYTDDIRRNMALRAACMSRSRCGDSLQNTNQAKQ